MAHAATPLVAESPDLLADCAEAVAAARALLAAQRPDLAARLVADPNPAPRLASPWRVGLGLIDLLLSRRVAGWAQDSARGLAGLRRLAALRR